MSLATKLTHIEKRKYISHFVYTKNITYNKKEKRKIATTTKQIKERAIRHSLYQTNKYKLMLRCFILTNTLFML